MMPYQVLWVILFLIAGTALPARAQEALEPSPTGASIVVEQFMSAYNAHDIPAMLEAVRFVTVWERAHWERGGEPASQSALAVYEIADGHIVRIWYYPAMK